MPFVLFLLWIIFNGRANSDVLASGILAALLVSVFCRRYIGYRTRNDLIALKKSGMLLQYLLLLVWKMILAGIQVIGIVLSPEIKIRPCIINFQPQVKSALGRALLAHSITLIPGSVTAQLTDKACSLHALTPEIAEGMRNSVFEKMIQKMEDGA